ncbi:protein of unknown function [Vibrio tapetis subsp. tapetis]|uniref:Uncharacterized protein n=1 Tax=Vibrio tapetis subsp. tapetis TaxID=1671868 RepID=A0A2N8Z9M3_9VIBR|nr:protein of unknown function [Vibrio tapetis subsp. tapetis]
MRVDGSVGLTPVILDGGSDLASLVIVVAQSSPSSSSPCFQAIKQSSFAERRLFFFERVYYRNNIPAFVLLGTDGQRHTMKDSHICSSAKYRDDESLLMRIVRFILKEPDGCRQCFAMVLTATL